MLGGIDPGRDIVTRSRRKEREVKSAAERQHQNVVDGFAMQRDPKGQIVRAGVERRPLTYPIISIYQRSGDIGCFAEFGVDMPGDSL